MITYQKGEGTETGEASLHRGVMTRVRGNPGDTGTRPTRHSFAERPHW